MKNFLDHHPLWFYIRSQKVAFSIGMIFLLITNTADGLYPLILRRGIDQISNGEPFSEVSKTAILFFACMSLLAFTRYVWRVYFGKYHTLAAEDLRNRIFQHLTQMGPQYFKKTSIGELMSLITNDVQAFRQAIGSAVLILVDGVSIIIIIFPLMYAMEPSWTWKTLIFLPIVPFMIWKVNKLIYDRFTDQQDKLSELAGFSQETVSGIRVIKSFALEDKQLEHYNKISKDFENTCNHVAKVDSLFSPVMQFGVASGTVVLFFLAGPDVLAGVVSLGTFVAFQRYIQKMVWPMTALGLGFSQYQKGMASYARIKKVLSEQTDIPDTGSVDISGFESLEVSNLSFKYHDGESEALKKISFCINKGEKVGLIGPVGSGKSTLLHLLSRLFPKSSGEIKINGLPIESISQRSLRQNIAFVPQEAFLFSDSISKNMSLGIDEHPEVDEISYWSEVVDIKNEIETLPQSFDSELGERGVNLSGGQKQRLTIARGLMTKAPFLMLDDSLSAVDHKTEKVIQNHLKENLDKKKTQLIVTHRLSTIEDADQIIVLNQGQIEAIGTHKDLIEKSPTYRNIALLQGYTDV